MQQDAQIKYKEGWTQRNEGNYGKNVHRNARMICVPFWGRDQNMKDSVTERLSVLFRFISMKNITGLCMSTSVGSNFRSQP
jgi:hypothetical protein